MFMGILQQHAGHLALSSTAFLLTLIKTIKKATKLLVHIMKRFQSIIPPINRRKGIITVVAMLQPPFMAHTIVRRYGRCAVIVTIH